MRLRRDGTLAAGVGLALLAQSTGAFAKDWTQIYVGAGIGADVVSTEIDASIGGLADIGADDVGTGAFGASLRIGADYQVNNWLVVGAFANVDWSEAETTFTASAAGSALSLDLLGIEHAWTVGVRAGTLVAPDTLSYLLLGYTEVTFSDISFGGLLPDLNVPEGKGVVIGSGFEHRLTSNISLTGEYRASYLDDETLFSEPGVADISTETVLHTGRIGIAYRFGGGGEAEVAERPTSSWTGFYAGIGTGVSGVDGDIGISTPLLGGIAGSGEGLVGGDFGGSLVVGYDHRLGPNWVAGVFGAVDKTLQDSDISLSALGTSASVDLPIMDELYTVAARAGYLAASNTLVYGLVGYARMTATDLDVSLDGVGAGSFSLPTFEGITYGGGIETLIGRGFSLRAEYRYADLEEETLFSEAGITATADADVHTTRVLINYRFDRESEPVAPLK